jgi:hypothetical protein
MTCHRALCRDVKVATDTGLLMGLRNALCINEVECQAIVQAAKQLQSQDVTSSDVRGCSVSVNVGES